MECKCGKCGKEFELCDTQGSLGIRKPPLCDDCGNGMTKKEMFDWYGWGKVSIK